MSLVLIIVAIVLFILAAWPKAQAQIPVQLGWLGLAALATSWALLTF